MFTYQIFVIADLSVHFGHKATAFTLDKSESLDTELSSPDQCVLVTCQHQSPEPGARSPMPLFLRWRTQTAAPRSTKQTKAFNTFSPFIYISDTDWTKVT